MLRSGRSWSGINPGKSTPEGLQPAVLVAGAPPWEADAGRGPSNGHSQRPGQAQADSVRVQRREQKFKILMTQRLSRAAATF
jgi:hypothetical protein